jgi:hypothetical protein
MACRTHGSRTEARRFGEATARREAVRVARKQDEQPREQRDEERGGFVLGAKRTSFDRRSFLQNKDPPAEKGFFGKLSRLCEVANRR